MMSLSGVALVSNWTGGNDRVVGVEFVSIGVCMG